VVVAKKILIIDDEEDFLRSASLTLRMSGYPYITTCTGVLQAKVLCKSNTFSLVHLDIMMPDGSGRELLPELVELLPDTPIIMCTAVNEVDVGVECILLLPNGMQNHFP
jgi:DNA-binding NtrC family response regulator